MPCLPRLPRLCSHQKIVFLRLNFKTVADPNAASEFHGWVLAHYAVRWLMHSAGSAHEVKPGRLSFVANVQLLKRAQPQSGAFPPVRPRLHKRWFAQVLEQAAALLCVSSRGRTNPRMVIRRNSPYASHDRALPLNRSQIFHPELLPPLALSKRKWVSQARKRQSKSIET